MNDNDQLKEELTTLRGDHNRLLKTFAEIILHQEMEEKRQLARFEALISLTQEMAAKAGVDKDAFWHHYKQRMKHCLDRAMKELEDSNPKYAAQTDDRVPEDFDFPDSIPPLFEEP